jgi:hypothetical protein
MSFSLNSSEVGDKQFHRVTAVLMMDACSWIRDRVWSNSENSLRAHDTSIDIGNVSRRTEVIALERKTKILMISAVLVLAILSGIAAMAYANGMIANTSRVADVVYSDDGYFLGGHGHEGRQGCGLGHWRSITVSQGFKDNVINIAKNDTDVQNLLNDGYNITTVRPIINATVEADGTVTLEATSAVVMLEKDTTGRASVWVNLEEGKVTRIEILTRTVIEKP